MREIASSESQPVPAKRSRGDCCAVTSTVEACVFWLISPSVATAAIEFWIAVSVVTVGVAL